MKKQHVIMTCLSYMIMASCFVRSGGLLLRGVSPEDEKEYYSSNSKGTISIKCKDGSKSFTLSQLNDDFCDCPDGTDEPGTSACPSSKFHCPNAGHTPLSIFSSRVNDAICDCCDGSDEYDGKTRCPNTCWEAGKVARDRLKKKILTYQEGVTLRKREVEQAKIAVANDEAELSRLKNDEKVLKGLVQQLKDRKEQIEKEEEKERLQKEREEKEKKEADKAAVNETVPEKKDKFTEEPMKSSTTDEETIRLSEDIPSYQDVEDHTDYEVTLVDVDIDDAEKDGSSNHEVREHHDLQQHASEKEEASSDADLDTGSKANDATTDMGSLSREELGRMVGSRWTGKKIDQQSGEADAEKDNGHENHDETPKNDQEEEYNGYDSETEDEHPSYDDDDAEDHTEDFGDEDHGDSSSYKYDTDDEMDLSDITSTSSPTWLEKIQHTVRNILQAVNLSQTPVDKYEAAHVRNEYDESSAKLSKIQSRISSLSQKLKQEFGPEKEFYSFYGQCFETKQNKYVYKICPFKQATQVEGHSTTSLGNWENFEESYRVMHFSSGDKCWNGPDRSLKVRLRCGLKNELTDVDEPSRCEYVALLSTPTICLEEKLKELEGKLDLLNKEQPHDEF